MNRGQGRTHGVASTYPFCTAGPGGKACSPCKEAQADKIAGQRFRRRRRRVTSGRSGADAGPATNTVMAVGLRPKGVASGPVRRDKPPDRTVGRRDEVRAMLYQMIGLINEGKAARFTEDQSGDMAIMAELLDEYVTHDPESGALLCSRFEDDGSLILWEDENA
jgi:hypothetical protein